MRSLVLAFAIALSSAIRVGAQTSATPESPRLRALRAELARDHDAALSRFWDAVRAAGTPLVEPIPGDGSRALVTFLFRGADSTRNVAIFGGPATSVEFAKHAFQRLPGTDVWYRSYALRRDARFQYKLATNVDLSALDLGQEAAVMRRLARFALDPLNPRRIPLDTARVPAFFVNSIVELSAAPPQPWLARRPGVPAGHVADTTFASRIMGNERALSVYTPPGFAREAGPYDLLVLFDREAYSGLVPLPTILDNLIADRRIPPVVAVMVSNPNGSRSAELPCNRRFADFLATELVPWARSRYAVSDAPARTTLGGASYGGLASTCAALFHPERFGNVISQSGSYWWGPDTTRWTSPEWVRAQFAARPRLPIRFYQNVGLMESGPTQGGGPSMVDTNRRLRDVLRAKGYEVHYAEYNGAHELLNWRGYLADALIALRGSPATSH